MDKISDETVRAFLKWLGSREWQDPDSPSTSPEFWQHPDLVGRTKELTAFAAGVNWSDDQVRK